MTDGVMQEIDVSTGLVMYEWTSLDHVGAERILRLAASTLDDGLAVSTSSTSTRSTLDRDGSLLISARNTWTVYDVDARDRPDPLAAGGQAQQLQAGAGTTRTAWQHDPRELPDGSISIFDNGASPTVHRQSRGIVARARPRRQGRRRCVSQFTHPPRAGRRKPGQPAGARERRLVRRLGSGTVLLGVQRRAASCCSTPTSRRTRSPTGPSASPGPAPPPIAPAFAVRARRHRRRGPSTRAGTAPRRWPPGGCSAGGDARDRCSRSLTAARSGFETAIALPAGTIGPYVTVQALDASGAVIGTAQVSKFAGA